MSAWTFLFTMDLMIFKLFNLRTNTIRTTAILLGVSAFLSRVLGLFRDNLLATLLDKTKTDIYFAAFRIPDFIYGILIAGGIAATFLPLFADSFKKNRKEAENFLNSVLTIFLMIMIVVCAILAVFTPQLIDLITPGFSQAEKATAVSLTRIMLLSPILLGLSSVFSGLLHYFNLFFAFSLAPILYNLGIIFGILFFEPAFGIKGLAFGVILGAFFHFLVQIPSVLRLKFRINFAFNLKNPNLKKLLYLTLPRMFGSAAFHINLIIITAIASTLEPGSLSIFNFSNNIYWVPIGLIGISFATASFPFLTRNWALGQIEDFKRKFSSVFSHIFFLIIPLSFLMFFLRKQIVELIFGTSIMEASYFSQAQLSLTAASLGVFSFSLFAAALIPFLARAFFAILDTKTPVKIAIFSVTLNIFLCYFFIWSLGNSGLFRGLVVNFLGINDVKDISVIGLSLAISLTSIIQFFLLSFYLKRKIKELNFKEIYQNLIKTLVSAILMSVFVIFSLNILDIFTQRGTLFLLLYTLLTAGIGVFSYFIFSLILKSKEAISILRTIFFKF